MSPPKNRHMFGFYITSKQSHMKVGLKKRRLGVGLIKTLINLPSFALGLMTRRKHVFLSLTPPNHFDAYSMDKSLHFVHIGMSETFLSVVRHFLMV